MKKMTVFMLIIVILCGMDVFAQKREYSSTDGMSAKKVFVEELSQKKNFINNYWDEINKIDDPMSLTFYSANKSWNKKFQQLLKDYRKTKKNYEIMLKNYNEDLEFADSLNLDYNLFGTQMRIYLTECLNEEKTQIYSRIDNWNDSTKTIKIRKKEIVLLKREVDKSAKHREEYNNWLKKVLPGIKITPEQDESYFNLVRALNQSYFNIKAKDPSKNFLYRDSHGLLEIYLTDYFEKPVKVPWMFNKFSLIILYNLIMTLAVWVLMSAFDAMDRPKTGWILCLIFFIIIASLILFYPNLWIDLQ